MRFTISLIIVALLCFNGCVHAQASEADYIKIVSIENGVFIDYNTPVTFKVTAEYSFYSGNEAVIYLGFNTEEIGRYRLVADNIRVKTGQGRVELYGTVLPKMWGTPDSPNGALMGGVEATQGYFFQAYVNLSRYPHEKSWDPLHYDAVAVTLDKSASELTTDARTGEDDSAASAPSDSDNDGIPDEWETNGIDFDGDGSIDVDLPSMGADPNVKDIFIEVDSMRSMKPFGFKIDPDYKIWNLEFDAVYQAFRAHNINIHIDNGPDSYNFVNGKRVLWGDLSRGNFIGHSATVVVDNTPYSADYGKIVADNFDLARRAVFKYCLVVDHYHDGDGDRRSTGTSFPVLKDVNSAHADKDNPLFTEGGQYFLVALGRVRELGYTYDDIAAGTFMHELGHVLGLGHGGCDAHNYKPNYMSIMSYAYQTDSILNRDFKLNYSTMKLPTLDEEELDESSGIDPNGQLARNTRIIYYNKDGSTKVLDNVRQAAIDFNGNGVIDSTPIAHNINLAGDYQPTDNKLTSLYGFNDWEHLVLKSPNMYSSTTGLASGFRYVNVAEMPATEIYTLAPKGTGSLAYDGYLLYANRADNRLFIRVNNLADDAVTFHAEVTSEILQAPHRATLHVDGSNDQLSNTILDIPVNARLASGEYTVNAKLYYASKVVDTLSFTVRVDEPSPERMSSDQQRLNDSNHTLPDVVAKYYTEQIANQLSPPTETSTAMQTTQTATTTALETTITTTEAKQSDTTLAIDHYRLLVIVSSIIAILLVIGSLIIKRMNHKDKF